MIHDITVFRSGPERGGEAEAAARGLPPASAPSARSEPASRSRFTVDVSRSGVHVICTVIHVSGQALLGRSHFRPAPGGRARSPETRPRSGAPRTSKTSRKATLAWADRTARPTESRCIGGWRDGRRATRVATPYDDTACHALRGARAETRVERLQPHG